MQAGDSLSFIKPFHEGEECTPSSECVVDLEDYRMFIDIQNKFLNTNQEAVHTFHVLEDAGVVTVREASYRVAMPDSSYLHILVHHTKIGEQFSNMGISVVEYLNTGLYNGGYFYSFDTQGLLRTTAPPDAEEDEIPEDVRSRHYTMYDAYADRVALNDALVSDDELERAHAEQELNMIHAEATLGEAKQAVGIDSLTPLPAELEKLRELIWDATPFPLHQT